MEQDKNSNNSDSEKKQIKLDNIYHCTIHKAGSQWLKGIFSDKRMKNLTGLEPYEYEKKLENGYDKRKIHERSFAVPFPDRTVVTPLYIGYEGYLSIPKPLNYKTIVVLRDPRDLVISHYFSKKFSHPVQHNPGLQLIRQKLLDFSQAEGLNFIIECLKNDGTFEALRSWASAVNAIKNNENMLFFKFEDLTKLDSTEQMKKLFPYLDIKNNEKTLLKILNDYSFAKLSGGRLQGEEEPTSHYRKGVHGDWQNYFDSKVKEFFLSCTHDLLQVLDYETTPNW